MNLGTIIRRERKKRDLTLKMVAERAGLSQGFLSQVENDVNSPSVETLVKICNAIGVDAGRVIQQAGKQERVSVIRRADWQDVDFPPSGFVTTRFFPPENRRVVDTSVLGIEPGGRIPARKNVKNGQEMLCVLKGAVRLVHGGQEWVLETGDAVHFLSHADRQEIANDSRAAAAVVFWVGTL